MQCSRCSDRCECRTRCQRGRQTEKGLSSKKPIFLKRVFKKSFFFKACVWALPPKMLCSSMAKCARVTEKLLADIFSFETDVSDFSPSSLIFSISLLTDNYYFSTIFFSIFLFFYFSFSFLFSLSISFHFITLLSLYPIFLVCKLPHLLPHFNVKVIDSSPPLHS